MYEFQQPKEFNIVSYPHSAIGMLAMKLKSGYARLCTAWPVANHAKGGAVAVTAAHWWVAKIWFKLLATARQEAVFENFCAFQYQQSPSPNATSSVYNITSGKVKAPKALAFLPQVANGKLSTVEQPLDVTSITVPAWYSRLHMYEILSPTSTWRPKYIEYKK